MPSSSANLSSVQVATVKDTGLSGPVSMDVCCDQHHSDPPENHLLSVINSNGVNHSNFQPVPVSGSSVNATHVGVSEVQLVQQASNSMLSQ